MNVRTARLLVMPTLGRLDFFEIGRACTVHQGNFLASACGGEGMVGANTLINSIFADSISHGYMLD